MFSSTNAFCPTHVPAHHPCHFSRFSVVAKVNNAPTFVDYDDNETETTIEIAVLQHRDYASVYSTDTILYLDIPTLRIWRA